MIILSNLFSVFDQEKLNAALEALKNAPPFQPRDNEPLFTVTQSYKDGSIITRCTLYFVFRNNEMVFYDSKTERI